GRWTSRRTCRGGAVVDQIVVDTICLPVPACNSPPQDADGDGDVDLVDFGVFQACFNGPNRPWRGSAPQRSCACFDQDMDNDVDLTDFGVVQAYFNGPNRCCTNMASATSGSTARSRGCGQHRG
ncbi:MAG: hypothetical protein ACPMAQ_11630, partial [Phycisphaerae bacterium]